MHRAAGGNVDPRCALFARPASMGQGRSGRAGPSRSMPARRAPMSKYIYGQFIEHLGRCIYGGIWAEMLEDRKFFDVGRGGSPWKAMGGADTVTMDRQAALRRRSTRRGSQPPGGIVQGELALRKGKHYVGRIWLAGEPQAAPVTGQADLGRGPDGRQTVTIDTTRRQSTPKTPLKFIAGRRHASRAAWKSLRRAKAASTWARSR